jgi:hypothetical protein
MSIAGTPTKARICASCFGRSAQPAMTSEHHTMTMAFIQRG